MARTTKAKKPNKPTAKMLTVEDISEIFGIYQNKAEEIILKDMEYIACGNNKIVPISAVVQFIVDKTMNQKLSTLDKQQKIDMAFNEINMYLVNKYMTKGENNGFLQNAMPEWN